MARKRTPEEMAIIRKYDSETYQLVQIKPKIEEAERMREYAKERGESLTRLVVRSVDTQIFEDAKMDAAVLEMVEAASLEFELDAILEDLPNVKTKRKKK